MYSVVIFGIFVPDRWVIAISYDKSDPMDTKNAFACYEELLRANVEAGYIPYRLGIQSMEYMIQKEDMFWDVVRDIKKALDPAGILSPGRYCR